MLKNKKVIISGIRNKWSIAWGAALSAHKAGAEVIFTYGTAEAEDKIKELISEIPNAKAYPCKVDTDEDIRECFEIIKKNHGKVDGFLHAIAHANTSDLRNDFVLTSKDGYSHAMDVSSYSLVGMCRIAQELELFNEDASVVTLTYYGSEKVIRGYNVMGVAKAALEACVRYLAVDLGKMGIRVNAISAGPIKTLSAKGIKDFSDVLTLVEERAPLKRNVTIHEVGDSVTFLFSNMSRGITGENIHVDSGFSNVSI